MEGLTPKEVINKIETAVRNAKYVFKFGMFEERPEIFFELLKMEEVRIHPIVEPTVTEDIPGIEGKYINIKDMVGGGTEIPKATLILRKKNWFENNQEIMDLVQANYTVAKNEGVEAQQEIRKQAWQGAENIDNPFED